VAVEDFQETNINWELQRLGQRIGEGIEGLLAQSGSSTDPEAAHPWIAQLLFWLIIGGLVLFVGRWLYLLLWPLLRQWLQGSPINPLPSDASAIAPPLSLSDWLARSHQARQRGQYTEACQALYMAALHHLDQQNLIPLDPSRTDGEYLHLLDHLVNRKTSETRTLRNPVPYQMLIRLHERLCFGTDAPSLEECDRCWQAFHALSDANRP
jgi:hypothetical protein